MEKTAYKVAVPEKVSETGKAGNAIKRRVAIVYPRSVFDSVPCLCNTASLLAEYGYFVDIFTYQDGRFAAPTFESPKITVRMLGEDTTLAGPNSMGQTTNGWLRRQRLLFVAGRVGYRIAKDIKRRATVLSVFAAAALQIWWSHRKIPYCCFLGVDPEGLSEANHLRRLVRVPLAYYSLELLLTEELNGGKAGRLKQREKSLSRRAVFTIIQDTERAQLLAADNQIPLEKFVLVPNSPVGPARRKATRYWHERFGLATNIRVALHAGYLGEWTGLEKIVKSARDWPESWVLVVHTRYDAERSAEVEELRKLATPGRVFLSLKPVARSEYDELVDGADVGIAFYVPVAGSTYTQQNIQAIGLSSGKIAYYLRSGLPTIVNQAPSISALVQREGCGIAVEGAEEIASALENIEHAYEDFSASACRVFNEQLDFARAFRNVTARIDLLGAVPS